MIRPPAVGGVASVAVPWRNEVGAGERQTSSDATMLATSRLAWVAVATF